MVVNIRKIGNDVGITMAGKVRIFAMHALKLWIKLRQPSRSLCTRKKSIPLARKDPTFGTSGARRLKSNRSKIKVCQRPIPIGNALTSEDTSNEKWREGDPLLGSCEASSVVQTSDS